MANGYCTPILTHIEALATCNPAKKLSPLGFTQMVLCCMDGTVTPLNEKYAGGHTRDLTVKYRKRPLQSAVLDTPSSCDVAVQPAYNEFSLPGLLYREYSVYIPDSLIRQYCKDASQKVKINAAGNAEMSAETSVMREVYELLLEGGAALLQSLNRALVTQMSTQFGVNVVTGNANAVALTVNLGTTLMTDAKIRLMTDWRENELCDDVCIVGNGPFANYDLVKNVMAGQASNGLDAAKMAGLVPRVWFDKDTRTVWGSNQVGVFERGSLALLTQNMYAGNFGGRHGTSNFFSMPLPVHEYCCPQECLENLLFDVQIKEIDCPTELTINDGEEPETVGKGVLVTLSKRFSLFVKPDLYQATDPLAGTNGTLRYTITEA